MGKREYFNSEKSIFGLDFQNHGNKVGFPVLLLGHNPMSLENLTEEMVLKCFTALCVQRQRSCQQSLLCRTDTFH